MIKNNFDLKIFIVSILHRIGCSYSGSFYFLSKSNDMGILKMTGKYMKMFMDAKFNHQYAWHSIPFVDIP